MRKIRERQTDVADAFAERYKQAAEALKKGHTGLTHYLISTLPPEDKKNFEYGQLEFFRTDEYKMGTDFVTQTLTKRGHTLDVKITRNKQISVYRIDTHAGTLSNQYGLNEKYSSPYDKLDVKDASKLTRTLRFNPLPDEHGEKAVEKPARSQTPRAFDSERTDYIARVYAHDLDLHSDDLLQHAGGMKRSPRQGQ